MKTCTGLSKTCTGLLTLGILVAAQASFADTNVALGKTVTLSGTFDPAPPNGPPSSVTDGLFLPEGTQFQTGTISWAGTSSIVSIDLGSTFTLTGFQVQADNNDTYSLQYLDSSNTYQDAYLVPTLFNGGGVSTRPVFTLATPISAQNLRFFATSGDNLYSVSEIQAFGNTPAAVPEPGSIALLASMGTIGAAFLRRRKAACKAA